MPTQVPLPPFPVNAPPGSFTWVDWFKKLADFINQITDVSGGGEIPGPINISGPSIVLGSVSNSEYARIANFVMFTLDCAITATQTSGNLTVDVPVATFPPCIIDDVFIWETSDGVMSGEGTITNETNVFGSFVRLTIFNFVNTVTFPHLTMSGRYFFGQ